MHACFPKTRNQPVQRLDQEEEENCPTLPNAAAPSGRWMASARVKAASEEEGREISNGHWRRHPWTQRSGQDAGPAAGPGSPNGAFLRESGGAGFRSPPPVEKVQHTDPAWLPVKRERWWCQQALPEVLLSLLRAPWRQGHRGMGPPWPRDLQSTHSRQFDSSTFGGHYRCVAGPAPGTGKREQVLDCMTERARSPAAPAAERKPRRPPTRSSRTLAEGQPGSSPPPA